MDINEVLAFLKDHEDKKKAQFDQKIMLDKKKHYGLYTRDIKRLAKICSKYDLTYPINESFEMDLLKGLAYVYSSRSLKEKLDFLKDYYKEMDNWAYVDAIYPYLKCKEEDYELVYSFFKDNVLRKEEVLVRFCYILYFNYLDNKYIDDVFSYIYEDRPYYILMAEAWLLSYFYLVNKDKTLEKIKSFKYKGDLQRFTIRKILDSRRVLDMDKKELKSIYENQKN